MFHKKCYEQWMNGCPNCRYRDTRWYYTLAHNKCLYIIGTVIKYCKKVG